MLKILSTFFHILVKIFTQKSSYNLSDGLNIHLEDFKAYSRNLHHNKCFVRYVLAPSVRIWACNSSLELSLHKNDYFIRNFRFARTATLGRENVFFTS